MTVPLLARLFKTNWHLVAPLAFPRNDHLHTRIRLMLGTYTSAPLTGLPQGHSNAIRPDNIQTLRGGNPWRNCAEISYDRALQPQCRSSFDVELIKIVNQEARRGSHPSHPHTAVTAMPCSTLISTTSNRPICRCTDYKTSCQTCKLFRSFSLGALHSFNRPPTTLLSLVVTSTSPHEPGHM